ncbi:hypothetical protein ACNOYE_36170 [Nannocystaceae bacterium ST9]
MKKKFLSSILFVAFVSSACGEASNDVLAKIQADDLAIEFAQLDDGTVVVSEVGPSETSSVLAYLAGEHATPLEMFIALSPNGDVPIELEDHHRMVTSEPPRSLSVPDSSFRSFSGSVGAASCTVASDDDWFDDLIASTGWTYQWYWSSTLGHTPSWKDSASKTTANLITHVCNYSESGGSAGIDHKVIHSSTVQYSLTGIDPGERSVIYVLSDNRTWTAEVEGPGYPQSNVVRFGMIAP